MPMRTFSYAYPSSDKAKELGFYKTGCFYITVVEPDDSYCGIFAYESAKTCLRFWDVLEDYIIAPFSFFGVHDNDENRRKRYES